MTHRILVLTSDPQRLAAFSDSLTASHGSSRAMADSGAAALSDVMKHPPPGVIVDENLPDMPGLELVRPLLPINAMINTAVISGLAERGLSRNQRRARGTLPSRAYVPERASSYRWHRPSFSAGAATRASSSGPSEVAEPKKKISLWLTSAWG